MGDFTQFPAAVSLTRSQFVYFPPGRNLKCIDTTAQIPDCNPFQAKQFTFSGTYIMTVGSTHFTSILRDHFASHRASVPESTSKGKGKGKGAGVDNLNLINNESSDTTIAIDITAVEALLKEKRRYGSAAGSLTMFVLTTCHSKQTEQDSTGR